MKQTTIILALLFITLSNCTKEASLEEDINHVDTDEPNAMVHEDYPDDHPYRDMLLNHQMNLADAELVVRDLPDGTTEELYLVEGDVTLAKETFQQIQQQQKSHQRQAVHKYRVKGISQINVYCKTNDSKLSTGVNRAIHNYNSVNGMNIQFVRVPYSYLAHIHVYKSTYASYYGGESGYPNPSLANLMAGKTYPYRWVRIGYGVSSLSPDEIEHVVTHEIGHCIGVWHTDWSTGLSCNTYTPDATPAWQVLGTPTYDPGSIMNKCYSTNTTGEFSYFDRFALSILF